jgi:type I restriction enzyme S subunit
VTVLVPKTEKLHAKFLYHYLRSRTLPDAGYSRHFKFLKQTQVPVPPLDEQRRIVGLLDRAAEIRRRADAARAKARAIIPAVFLDTFGDPATNPKGWPRQPLGALISKIIGGKNVEAGNGSSPYQILKVSAVSSGNFQPEEAKPAPDGYQPPPDYHIRKGDFLFSRANTSALVGAVAIVENENITGLLLPDKIWRIEWRQEAIEPRFAYSLLRSNEVRRIFAQIASGTSDSMKNISQRKLGTIEVPIPPLPLQSAFAEQAQRVEATARALDAAAAKAEAMADALSAEAFG